MNDDEQLKQTIRVAVSGVAESKRQAEQIVANVFQAVCPLLHEAYAEGNSDAYWEQRNHPLQRVSRSDGRL